MKNTNFFIASLLTLFLAGCGGGGGSDSPADSSSPASSSPSFTAMTASPASVYAGQTSVHFVISGGGNLSGRTLTASFGGNACSSVFVSPNDASQLNATCTAPIANAQGQTTLQVFYQGTDISSGGASITLIDPDTQPAPTFASPTIETMATWGQSTAQLTITGGQNLYGRSFTATVAGIPCSNAVVSSTDFSRLKLTCTTPPGNASSVAVNAVVRYQGNDLTAGGIAHVFATCADLATPTAGVARPQLCNAEAGSLAVTADSTRGTWRNSFDKPMLIAPNGFFVGQQLIGFNGGNIAFGDGTWTTTSAEYLHTSVSPYNTSGTFIPLKEVSDPNTSGFKYTTYALENALAADQDSATGLWGSDTAGITLNIASNGNYTGTSSGSSFGACTLSGTLTPVNAATKFNLFNMTMVATGTGDCKLLKNTNLTGLASIGFVNTGTSDAPVWQYDLQLIVRAASQMYLIAYPVKQ